MYVTCAAAFAVRAQVPCNEGHRSGARMMNKNSRGVEIFVRMPGGVDAHLLLLSKINCIICTFIRSRWLENWDKNNRLCFSYYLCFFSIMRWCGSAFKLIIFRGVFSVFFIVYQNTSKLQNIDTSFPLVSSGKGLLSRDTWNKLHLF